VGLPFEARRHTLKNPVRENVDRSVSQKCFLHHNFSRPGCRADELHLMETLALYGMHASVRSVLNRAYYRGMVAADPCAELQELKRRYESALRVWGQYEFPLHNELAGARAPRSEQLKRRALDARNAANGRVLAHNRICPLCADERNRRAIRPVDKR